MTEPTHSDARITLPRPPQPASPFRFPIVAATVPVAASVAIWLLTGSTFALLFAALGPLAATGSYVDSRVTARRTKRRERERFAAATVATRDAISAHHRREIAELTEHTPAAVRLLADAHTDALRWAKSPRDVVPVHLGVGRVRSSLLLDRAGTEDSSDIAVEEQYQSLLDVAAELHNAPIAVNARLGIAIFGSPILARSLARALAVQLARTLSPTTTWVRFDGVFSAERWTENLPHRRLGTGVSVPTTEHGQFTSVQWGQLGEAEACISLSVVPEERHAPSGHRIVVAAHGSGFAVVRHPDRHQRRDFFPAFLGREQAAEWARAAKSIAARDGLTSASDDVPEAVAFAELEEWRATSSARSRPKNSLEAFAAVGGEGPVMLDLVAQGPHAIVGGTTGSGKSELLISWILAIAATSAPHEVTFLLVDFKGGSAFAHLDSLPHSVGVITDLDASAADRAFASLKAELRYRERTLAAAQARDISEVDELPRLVIVVDEFAAMMADYPQLHTLFSDIAARGRSLGMHLILCTQRPSGVVRDTLLANADLRISLRVNNGSDSSVVIGSDRAAELPTNPKGRAWIAHGSSSPQLGQFALASHDDIDRIAQRWTGSAAPRRPWCDPLPALVALRDLLELHDADRSTHTGAAASEGLRPEIVLDKPLQFGLVDLPEQQRRSCAEWTPQHDGNVLVLGAPGSGKTVALTTLLESSRKVPQARVINVGGSTGALWDALTQLQRDIVHRPAVSVDTIVGIDDLDAAIARCPEDYRADVIERLAMVMREGPAQRIWIVATTQRITPPLQSLVQLAPAVLRLRHSSKQDYVLAGGESEHFNATLTPGGGHWKGNRCQVAQSDGAYFPPSQATAAPLTALENVVVASTRVTAAAAAFEAAGWAVRLVTGAAGGESQLLLNDSQRPTALIGSLDDWNSRWGAIAALRGHAAIVLDGASPGDFRQLTRSRQLPPPLGAGNQLYWRLHDDGSAERVELVAGETASVT